MFDIDKPGIAGPHFKLQPRALATFLFGRKPDHHQGRRDLMQTILPKDRLSSYYWYMVSHGDYVVIVAIVIR